MISAFGLQSFIWQNNIKTLFLLCLFPFLFIFLLFLFGFINSYISTGDISYSSEYSIIYYVLPLWKICYIIAGIWFMISFLFHQRMINSITEAEYITREDFPNLYNMLENLCISRGIKTPKLAVIIAPEMNAFASGISDRTYTITVTSGLLENLNDSEIEAVLAHELTHIINRDVRLLIVSIVFVGIFSLLAELLLRKLFYKKSSRDTRLIIIALLVATFGYILALLIKFAISRKREYLADAGSVQLTKNPDAMISALRKISGNFRVSEMPSEIMQMCVENSPRFKFLSIFSTHPPIEDRIKALKLYAGGKI